MSIKSLLPGEEVAGLYTVVASESPESGTELWAAAAAAQMEVRRSFLSACQALIGQKRGTRCLGLSCVSYSYDWILSVQCTDSVAAVHSSTLEAAAADEESRRSWTWWFFCLRFVCKSCTVCGLVLACFLWAFESESVHYLTIGGFWKQEEAAKVGQVSTNHYQQAVQQYRHKIKSSPPLFKCALSRPCWNVTKPVMLQYVSPAHATWWILSCTIRYPRVRVWFSQGLGRNMQPDPHSIINTENGLHRERVKVLFMLESYKKMLQTTLY